MDTAASHKAVAFVPLHFSRAWGVLTLHIGISTGYPCHFYWLPLPSVRTVAVCCVACGSHDICTRIGSRVTMPVPSGRNFIVMPSLLLTIAESSVLLPSLCPPTTQI